jgi:hypothetical protein
MVAYDVGPVAFHVHGMRQQHRDPKRSPGARLYLNGEPVGNTPYTMTDTKIVGSATAVRLEMPGYATTDAIIQRNEDFDVGACIGGVFVLVPFLWIMGYKPTHTFELRPPVPVYPMPYQPPMGQPYPPAPGQPAQGKPAPQPAQPGQPTSADPWAPQPR